MAQDQQSQEIFKELFRIRMQAIEIPKRRREMNLMDWQIMEKLLVSQLAKNKTLTPASKQELREENFDYI